MRYCSALFLFGVSDVLPLASLTRLTKLDFGLLPWALPGTGIVHVFSRLTCLRV
jgi:hypothetical protein